MKKTVSAIKISFLVVAIVACSVLILSCASTPKGKTDDGFKYAIKDNSVTIAGYSGEIKDVVIPASIEGLPVTEIGERAFAGKKLTSVVFPETLIAIGAGAFSFGEFSSQNYITSITLPKNIKKIGSSAFNANSLTTIEVNHELDVKEEMGLPEHFTAWYLVHGGKTGVYTFENNKWLLNDKSPPAYTANFAVVSMSEAVRVLDVNGNPGVNYFIETTKGGTISGDNSVYILPEGICEITVMLSTRTGVSSGKVKLKQTVRAGEKYIIKYGIGGSGIILFGGGRGTTTFTIEKQ
jgi:hypothetical protein